ncbi:MAG: hypothetical protein ACQEQ4_04930 [Fibrobacterota bacterium]
MHPQQNGKRRFRPEGGHHLHYSHGDLHHRTYSPRQNALGSREVLAYGTHTLQNRNIPFFPDYTPSTGRFSLMMQTFISG